jgi:hypothetical protein
MSAHSMALALEQQQLIRSLSILSYEENILLHHDSPTTLY